jgi:hypothetical protein
VIRLEEESDGEDEERGCGEVSYGGEGHETIDAERLFPNATKQRGASGHEASAEVEGSDGGCADVDGEDFEGSGEDVAHEESAEHSESGGGEAGAVEGGGISDEMEERRAEEEACCENPESRSGGAAVESISDPAAAEEACDGCGLEGEGGVPCGLGLVEGKLVVEEVWQPSVQEPEAEEEDGEDGAEHEE